MAAVYEQGNGYLRLLADGVVGHNIFQRINIRSIHRLIYIKLDSEGMLMNTGTETKERPAGEGVYEITGISLK